MEEKKDGDADRHSQEKSMEENKVDEIERLLNLNGVSINRDLIRR